MLGASWRDPGNVVAVAALLAALAIPLTAFARRPRLSIEVDQDSLHSHVEAFGAPHIRLLVANARWRRSAIGTRVLLESYRSTGRPPTTLGSPSFGWTSAGSPDASVVIFSGTSRPFDLGSLIQGQYVRQLVKSLTDGRGDLDPEAVRLFDEHGDEWVLRLGIHHLVIFDGRDTLVPGSWTIRLVVGADDAAGVPYDVDLAWDGRAETAEEALEDLQVKVKRIRRWR